MLLVAGITASVLIQTMNTLQQQALTTGEETIRDVSGGLKVTHVSGYKSGSTIAQLAIEITPTVASDDIDLAHAYISISDSSKKKIIEFVCKVKKKTSRSSIRSINRLRLDSDYCCCYKKK